MLKQAQALSEKLVSIRRTIHQNPETSFEEYKTASLVANTLADLGVEYQTGVGITGVVARLGNGNGPVIGIRADMDALPIHEANDVPYRSQVDGKMHACGHDAHTTMLLGAAMLLNKADFDGEIRLLFQPSEEAQDHEGKSGAMRMIDDRAIEGLDACISIHVDGTQPVGTVSIRGGHILANCDTVYGKVIGKGGHGAMPDSARDPIFLLAPVLTALHGIVSRWVNPIQPAVITVGRVQGGTVSNVIPNDVELDITVRSMDADVREQLLEEIERAFSVARALGGDYELNVVRGYPALYNDPAVAEWIRETASDVIGAENVFTGDIVLAGEDFAYMAQASRGAMMTIGTREVDGPPRYVHHPEFDIDESCLPIGSAILAETALRFVEGKLK